MSIGLFGFVFKLFFSLIPLIVIAVFAVVIVHMLRSAKTGLHNSRQPVIPVPAVVASKRMDVVHTHHRQMHSHSSTTYYALFTFENGEQMELQVPGDVYGYLVEGDKGMLSLQGTRFVAFERR